MWEFSTEGTGRRAKIYEAKNESLQLHIGDPVEGEDFSGIVHSFKRGSSEKLHTAQLLILIEEDDEWFATSKLKWVGLNEIQRRWDLDLASVARAVDHRRRNLNSVVDLPSGFDLTAADNAAVIESLFSQSNSPKKRRSPQKQAKESSPGKRKAPVASVAETHIDEVDVDDEKEEFSDEDEYLPMRKRDQSLTTALAASSLESPQKKKKTNGVLDKPELILDTGAPNREQDIFPEEASPKDDSLTPEEAPLRTPAKSTSGNSSRRPRTGGINLLPIVETKPSSTMIDAAVMQLHPASEPATHPCREDQFDQLFIALESAISAETGTCIYVSGTPGTGKTSTIREVIGQLDLRVHEGELKPFTFLEINGMKLVHPNAAYEHLWEALGRGQMASSNAMTALEAAFTANESRAERGIMVVLLDELDQLVTKGQQLMYNFFNWPSLPNSRLIVIAVANTMDLPERLLSNKISSRVGLTRVQFPGYTFQELHEVLLQRLDSEELQKLVEPEALEYAARKVAGVGGDARRALDFVRQALAIAEVRNELPLKTAHVRDVIKQSQDSPIGTFVTTLGYATKILLCAIVSNTRRTDNIEAPLHVVLRLANQLVRSSANANTFGKYLYSEDSPARLKMFQSAVMELVEGGILVQQAIKGEATPLVRLMMPVATIKEFLVKDEMLQDMI